MTEQELKSAVVKMARDRGWLVFSTPQRDNGITVKSAKGYPDLTLCRWGRVMWFELKQDGRTLDPAQLEWFRHMPADAELHSMAHVITPAALHDGTVAGLLT